MPKFLNCFLTAVISSSLVLSSIYAISPKFAYGSQKVRGVNLGGWLVLEPWVTPSIFDNTGDDRIVDEYTFGQYQDHDKALETLTNHWDTWITESDFEAIAAANLNHVRLPIGHWAFDVSGGEPFVQGQLPYLDKAVTWAQAHGLNLIVDLHSGPGSQNGFDNSGQRKALPEWQTTPSNIQRTSAIVKTLANMYKDSEVVTVIGALNEPAGHLSKELLNVTKQYWHDSYQSIRYPYDTYPRKQHTRPSTDVLIDLHVATPMVATRESNTIVMIHDAFQDVSYWDGFISPPRYNGVIMDTHIYQIFTPEETVLTYSGHIQAACGRQSDLTTSQLWLVVGEWAPVPTDCGKYVNGRGVGSRYVDSSKPLGSCSDLTGNGSTFSSSYKTFLRQYWEAQVITYEKVQGWIQWTWKAEKADEWSYQAGLANGWIPQNPTDYHYPDICG